MSRLELVPRERSTTSFWVVDRPGLFLSTHTGAVELWRSHRPYAVNERLYTFATGAVDELALEDVDAALDEAASTS